ncbi:MAG: alpha/beta hydrolase [Alphaproteobacteria bacterium]|nr:alpha/beta hydrolase [Alphaproteobacteria bacterium]
MRRLAIGLVAMMTTLLAACAPTVQKPMVGIAMTQGPHFEKDAFVSFDGARLGATVWPAEGGAPWAVIVAVHGMNDYAEAFYLAAPHWAKAGVTTYAYDARGFGRSPNRGLWPGEALLTEDLRTAVAVARRAHPGAIVAVVGDSMGSATAIAAFGSDRPPDADRVVLTAPAVWGWSTLPDLYAVTLWTGAHTFPWRPVTPPKGVQRRIAASDNDDMLRKIGRDPNMLFSTRIDAIYGLVNLMNSASKKIGRIEAPVAFLYGAKDQVIPPNAARTAALALPPGARTAYYPNGYHMLLRDRSAPVVWDDVLAFVRDPAGPLPSGVGPWPPQDKPQPPAARETLTVAR